MSNYIWAESPHRARHFGAKFMGVTLKSVDFGLVTKYALDHRFHMMIIGPCATRVEHIGWRCYVSSIGLSSSFNFIYKPSFRCATFLATLAHIDLNWGLPTTICSHSRLIFYKNQDGHKFSSNPFNSSFQGLQNPTIGKSKNTEHHLWSTSFGPFSTIFHMGIS